MSIPQPAIQYVAGGTVQAGDGVYVERSSDADLLNLCRAGEFAYVLTSRQMGKSSLMIRTAEKLIEDGIKPAIIDLTELGTSTTAERWYRGFLEKVCEQLNLQDRLKDWWDNNQHLSVAQRFNSFLSETLLQQFHEQVVVFVDEIDTTLRLDFTDDFFASIRYLYIARAHRKVLTRLSFVLLGVASPGDLIKDLERTPFNIGRRVDLQDFTEQDAVHGLHAEAELVKSVFRYTGGHPYLTLRVFRSLAEQPLSSDLEQRIWTLFLGEQARRDSNLLLVRDMLTKRAPDREAVLLRYRQVHKGRQVPDEEADAVCAWLRLSGIVRSSAGFLQVRNLIYHNVFDSEWIQRNRRINWAKRSAWGGGIAVALLLFVGAILAPIAYFQKKDADKQRTAAEMARQEALVQRDEANKLRLNAEQARTNADKERSNAQAQRRAAEKAFGEANERRGEADRARQDAERLGTIAFSRQLAARSELLQAGQQIDLEPAALLSTEAMESFASFEADRALRELLRLMYGQVVCHKDRAYVARRSLHGHTVQVFEVASGKEAARFTDQDLVHAAVISADGRYLATGGQDKMARVFDVVTGKEIVSFKHDGLVYALAISGNGRYVVTGSRDKPDNLASPDERDAPKEKWGKTARVFDVASRKEVIRIQHDAYIRKLAISADGRYLTIISEDEFVRVFETANGRTVARLAHEAPPGEVPQHVALDALAISADGRYLATGDSDHVIRVFDAASKKELRHVMHQAAFKALAISADGRYVATGTEDKSVGYGDAYAPMDETVRVFETTSEKEVARFTHQAALNTLAVSAGGQYVVAGSRKYSEQRFEVDQGNVTHLTHESQVKGLLFSLDGRYMATRSGDNILHVFEATSGHEVTRLSDQVAVNALAISADGRYVATGNRDHTARVFEVTSGKEVARLKHPAAVSALAISADGRYVATRSDSYMIPVELPVYGSSQIFEVAKGNKIVRLNEEAGDPVAFSADGRYLVTKRANITAVFEATNGNKIARFDGSVNVNAVAVSADGRYLATASGNGIVQIFEVASRKEVARLTHQGPAYAVAFSKTGDYVATGGGDRTARVVEVASGKEVARMVSSDPVRAVSYTEEGRYLMTASTREESFVVNVNKNLLRPQDLIAEACSCFTRNLTTDEWREYVGTEVSYHKTCSNLPSPPGQEEWEQTENKNKNQKNDR